MIEPDMTARHLREKVVELLVRVEHLDLFATLEGLATFGSLCEMVGRCCQHLAAGRKDQAAQIARTVGRQVPHAFPLGSSRQELEDALEEIIAVLERMDGDHLH